MLLTRSCCACLMVIFVEATQMFKGLEFSLEVCKWVCTLCSGLNEKKHPSYNYQ
jgi:hypothetical protein